VLAIVETRLRDEAGFLIDFALSRRIMPPRYESPTTDEPTGDHLMADAVAAELLQLTQRLLDSIAAGDWATYQDLCDPGLTSFEPEALGQLVEGLEFHRFYFDLGGIRGKHHTTMCSPRVRLLGEAAIVSYVRLVQRLGPDGQPATSGFEETRVWQRQEGRWRHVHFHRSALRT
jgi:calcium/calmodulin-dependent protein kinase (CaM kinase) II